jgi:molecular chaperone GrpE
MTPREAGEDRVSTPEGGASRGPAGAGPEDAAGPEDGGGADDAVQAGETGPRPAEEATAISREEELLDRIARLMADFDNYRKRVRREQEEADHSIRSRLILKLLPILDDYDRARGAAGPLEHPADRDALLMILGRLAEVLEREGLTPIEVQPGDPFDPVAHEAIGTASSPAIPAQHVLDVFERGYLFTGRLLRPARVFVSSGEGDEGPEGAGKSSTRDGDQDDDGSDRKDPDG